MKLIGVVAALIASLAAMPAASAQYRSPKDLKGWKIGVTAPGSSTHMAVQNLLVKNGLKPDDIAAVGVGASAGAWPYSEPISRG